MLFKTPLMPPENFSVFSIFIILSKTISQFSELISLSVLRCSAPFNFKTTLSVLKNSSIISFEELFLSSLFNLFLNSSNNLLSSFPKILILGFYSSWKS